MPAITSKLLERHGRRKKGERPTHFITEYQN